MGGGSIFVTYINLYQPIRKKRGKNQVNCENIDSIFRIVNCSLNSSRWLYSYVTSFRTFFDVLILGMPGQENE